MRKTARFWNVSGRWLFFSAWVGAVLPLAPLQAAIVPAPDDQEAPAVVSNGNGYFIVWADKRTYGLTEYDIYGARVSSSGEVLDPGGIPICTDPGRQTSPRVAFDGQQYLVVWEDDRQSTADYLDYQIYGARVTTTGTVLEQNGFKITTNRVTRTGPAVASNGRGFFVVWVDWPTNQGAIADIYGSPVSSDGIVASPDGIPLKLAPLWQTDPRVVSANGEYLVTYHDDYSIWGLRVSPGGTLLSSAFRISSGAAEDRYGVASNGRDYFVVWGDERNSPSGYGWPKIYGTLVRSNGVVASPDGVAIATGALSQGRPKIASDGNDFLVAWEEYYDVNEQIPDIYAAKLTADGAVGSPARIAVNQLPGMQINVDVAFSASNFLAVWQDARTAPGQYYPYGAFDIYGRLISGAGSVSATNGFLISGAVSNEPPSITIAFPTNGAVFAESANILITSRVNDPDGAAASASVEFFANGGSIGRGQLSDPGPLHEAIYRLFWTNVAGGTYTLAARVTDQGGATSTSTSVTITVVSTNPPVVNVIATDPDAAESGPLAAIFPGRFTFYRSGDLQGSLSVSFQLSGSASNGVDYARLTNQVVFPAGAAETSLNVVPITDGLVEGTETVVVRLVAPMCAQVIPPPPGCYRVGPSNQATVYIADGPFPTNQPPVVNFYMPQNGVTFDGPTNIILRTYAQDREDSFNLRVEFFEGFRSLGVGTFVASLCPAPYCPYYTLTWSNVPPGNYTLTARATDRSGVSSTSTPVQISVRGTNVVCPPLIEWQADFGTPGQDYPRRIYATADGGYVFGGEKYSNTNYWDFWIVRMDANGNKIWEKTIGRRDSESFGDLKPLSDGGIIVGGGRYVNDDDYQFLLMRLDPNGNVLWEQTYGGAGIDIIDSLDVTADGGFILGGRSDSPADINKTAASYGRYDYWLVRVDAMGNKLWDRSFGGTDYDWIGQVLSLGDGGFLASGTSYSGSDGNKTSPNFGEGDAWLLRLDAQGDKIWERSLGGSGQDGGNVLVLPQGGFLFAGYSGSPPSGNKTSGQFGGGDAWVVRLDANGAVLWDASYGGFGNDYAVAAVPLNDGGFLLGADSNSDTSGNKSWPRLTSHDVWVVRIGPSGEKIWDRAFGGSGPVASWLNDLVAGSDGGFVVLAESGAGISGDKTVPNFGGSDAWVFKLPPLDRDCDGDGVVDMQDFCRDTAHGALVDAHGCAANQRDSDGDGVTDDLDQCPNTPPDTLVDSRGCSLQTPVCPPPVEWQQTYARDDIQWAVAARQLPDGGFLLAGSIQAINGIGTNETFGSSDAYVVRTAANGEKIWDRIFGGSAEDYLSGVALMPDGGAVLVGYSTSPADGNKTSPGIYGADGWLVRLDANGNKIWDKTFDGREEGFFRDIQRLPDGGFILAGSSSDGDELGWIVRLDAEGNLLWQQEIYHEENSSFNRVLALPNGDILAGGYNEDDDGNFSFWLARLNFRGEVLWERFYGGSGYDELTAIAPTSDGGFLIGGPSNSPADGSKTSPNFGGKDFWVVRVDANGNSLWQRSFGGGGEDELRDIAVRPDGGFILGGNSSFSSGGNKRSPALGYADYWIVRIDAGGGKVWDAAYGGDQEDYLLDLEATSDGGILLTGYSQSGISENKTAPHRAILDVWVLKLDSRNGCDLDGDGVTNDRDQCPDTPPGTVVDANGCPIRTVSPAPDDQDNPAVTSDGDNFFVVWMDRRNASTTGYDIYGARVSGTGQVLDPGGIPICTARDYQYYPAVAFDGVNYFVVWSDPRGTSPEHPTLELYGARVSRSGVVLDRNGIQLTHGEVVSQPTIAFNGTEYLVAGYAWEHNGHRGTTLLGVRVTPAGVVRDTEELVLHQSDSLAYPAVLSSLGGEWLLVWNGAGIEGARVAANGSVSSAFSSLDAGETWVHGLTAAGDRYFLASTRNRQFTTDTQLVDVYGTWISREGRPLSTLLISSNTNRPVAQPTSYMQSRPSPAGNGSDVLVVWEAGAQYTGGGLYMSLSDIRGARVNSNGVSTVFSICNAPQDQSHTAIAFNGKNFLPVWQDGRSAPASEYLASGHFDIYGARVSTMGAVSPPNGFLISGMPSNAPPTVTIIYPTNNAVFPASVNILLTAWVVDPDGPVMDATVEFFDGTTSIGFAQLADPGPPHEAPFRLFWTAVPIGNHILTAQATDSGGTTTISPAVRITVGSPPTNVIPVVTIRASDAEAAEQGSDPAVFVVTRSPVSERPLGVLYRVSGTASNGVDYTRLSGVVEIPAGAASAEILVRPIDDGLVEGTEVVQVGLTFPDIVPAVYPPLPPPYYLGEPNNAQAFIRDNDPACTNCPISELCLCDNAWRSHAEYVRCVIQHAWRLFRGGVITADQRRTIIHDAVVSNCGQHGPEPVRIHVLPQTTEECRRDGMQFVLSGDSIGACIIETSTDLVHWTPIEPNPTFVDGREVTCSGLEPVPARFYRARINPIP